MEPKMNTYDIARIASPIGAELRERWWDLMPEDLARKHRPWVKRIGGGLITFLSGTTSKSMNVVLNLGVSETAKKSMIDEVFELAATARAQRFSFHVSPSAQSSRIEKWLIDKNFRLHNYYRIHFRDTTGSVKIETDLTVKKINKEHAIAFGRIVCENFGWPAGRVPWIAATVGQRGFHHYMAFAEEVPVATGLLYVKDDCGYLAFGATMSRYRRRGGQGALIAARIKKARQLGLRFVTADTFAPMPGRPAVSYRNFSRTGFEDAYQQPVFVWEK